MANWFRHRTIVEEHSVSQAADKFCKKYSRFAEAFDALKWLLTRQGSNIDPLTRTKQGIEYHLYRQAGDSLAETPDIIVLFTCDSDEVVLVAINAEMPQSEED